jgi:cobaltochelatase CobS
MALSTKIARQVMHSVYDTLDERTESILNLVNERVQALSKNTKVAVAIKINDEPIKKLEKQAHPNLTEVVGLLKSGLTPLLVGPAGCGKSFVAHQAAEAMGLPFAHLCFTAGVSEVWLFGRQTPMGFVEGDFSKTYKNGGVFLADEFDAADPNLALSINTALANGHLYNPISGENIPRHPNFNFIAAANTFGKGGDIVYTGRSRLDGATLDRFTIVEIGYVEAVENALCPDAALADKLRDIRDNLIDRGSKEILSYRAFAKAYTLKHALGYADKKIFTVLFAAWSEDLRREVLPK